MRVAGLDPPEGEVDGVALRVQQPQYRPQRPDGRRVAHHEEDLHSPIDGTGAASDSARS